jgi:NitT/TauT family transport system substrate-binding protein
MTVRWAIGVLATATLCALAPAAAAQTEQCKGLRDISVGIPTAPPQLANTTPYVADKLGLFAKHCIKAKLIEFEGASSHTQITAVARSTVVGLVGVVSVARGLKAKQIFNYAPRLPHHYVVPAEVKTTADLKGRRLGAAGGGVGSFNWKVARDILVRGGLTVDDVSFVGGSVAGLLPAFAAKQIDGFAAHPETVPLAIQERKGAHVLAKLTDVMPDELYSTFGASDDFIAKNRDLLIDFVAALIEANRAIYREPDRAIPAIVEATHNKRDAIEYGWRAETEGCIWAINTGFDRSRTEATLQNAVRNGDIEPDKVPKVEAVIDLSIAAKALEKIGGPIEIKGCKL